MPASGQIKKLTPQEKRNKAKWQKTIGDPQGLSYETDLNRQQQHRVRLGKRVGVDTKIVALESSKKAKVIADAKKVKTVGHIKELEKWIETNAHQYKDVDKFYQAALKKFDKKKYEGLVRESAQPARKNVRNPVKAGKHIYLPSYRPEVYVSTGDIGGEVPKGARYNYKNLFELKGVDAGSKIRYVKDMMLINMMNKNPVMKKFAKKLDKVVLGDLKDLDQDDIDKVKLFTRKHLKATAARPNLFRSYLNKRHEDFEKLRKEQRPKSGSIYSQLQKQLENPNLSEAAKKKIRNTLTNMDRARKYHVDFKKEFPELFEGKKVYAITGLAKKKLEEGFDFEHKIAKGSAAVNKLPATYYQRGSYVPTSFNQAKLKDFDTPLLNLMTEYQEQKAPKIENQIKALFKDFNEKSAGYLDEVRPYFDRASGSVIVEDSTPMFKVKDYGDYKKMMAKNLKHSQAYLSQFKGGDYAFNPKILNNLLSKLVDDGTRGGSVCGLKSVQQVALRKAPGGFIGSDCSTQVKQALQENPDQLIKEAAEAKVKPGQSTGFRNIARQILSKIPKGGRLGAILAGAGAVGAGAWAMTGKAEADESQDTMKYNPYTGEFENTMTGDPETQAGVLNWIADNPTTAGFAAMPALFGTGLGASALNAKKIAGYLTSWRAIIPALAVPHVMHEAKIGKDVGEIALNPLNALWALGIRNADNVKEAEKYYKNLKKGQRGLDMTTLKSLKNVQGWKNLPSAMRTALMSPAATGTNLAMGQWGRKPFLAGVKALKNQATKQAAKQVGKAGLGYLARRAALTTAVAAVAPFAALPLGIGTGVLGLGYLGWQGYKEYKKGSEVIDSMRSKGKINEKTAEGYYDLLKRNIVPFGDQLLGGDNLEMFGDNLNPDQQLDLQKVMEDEIGSSLLEEQEDRATSRSDFFDTFSEGGRVGMRLGGGMDRRGFLKWLMGLGAAAVGAGSGLFKGAGTKVAKEAAKTAVKAEFPGIPGMPEWFPRLVAKIKTEGSLKSMADADYVEGDIYSIMVPIKKRIFDKLGKPTGEYKIEQTKVLMEHNPRSKDIDISWNVDDFDGTMTRRMRFSPGKTGYQRFNSDPEFPTSTETLQVEVERPMFEYGNPDQSNPARDEFISMDIFEEEDQVVNWFKNWVKGTDDTKPKWTKDMEKNFETHVDTGESFGDATSKDDALPFLGNRYEKAGGGEIARRPGAVAPLSGPEGIMSLSFSPKRVNVVGS